MILSIKSIKLDCATFQHQCKEHMIFGEVDSAKNDDLDSINWGDSTSRGWKSCPYCAEKLPQKVVFGYEEDK